MEVCVMRLGQCLYSEEHGGALTRKLVAVAYWCVAVCRLRVE